jgi:peptidyl-prolyl cis-trans isomerase C
MTRHLLRPLLSALFLLTFTTGASVPLAAWAAEPGQVVATVNGVPISSDLLDLILAGSPGPSANEPSDTRAILRNELIVREVLAQAARREGLEQNDGLKNRIFLAQQSILADALIALNNDRLGINETELRADYARQVNALRDAEQFLVSHIVLATEAEARIVLNLVKTGSAFEVLAREKSIDPTRQNDGLLGWVIPNQLVAPLASVLPSLSPGSVYASPIQTAVGWHVLRLAQKRKFVPPSFEESRPQLVNALLTKQRNELIQRLLRESKVELPD